MERIPLQTTVGQKIKRAETFKDATGTALYHVVYLDPDGFIIVPADDLVEPVIAFAPRGRFDPSTTNPLGALVSRDLPARIAKARGVKAAQAQGPHLAARNKWEQLKSVDQLPPPASGNLSSVSDVRVAPLTLTMWDQSTVGADYACYNYYTPPYADGNAANDVCGCVATAMAQLMRFWQYPTGNVGTNAFSIQVNGVSQNRNLRGGDGAGGPYIWTNMVLNPNGLTNAQCQAIGALCADAGVVSHMQYTAGNSGAWLIDAKSALLNTFYYTSAVHGGSIHGGTDIGSGLTGMVNPNLDAGCPVLFGIRSTTSGSAHAIVCDGYGYNLSTLYHHLNLGWGGASTAWYNLPNIGTGYNFNMVDDCVYNVWTNGTGEIISGRVTDNGGVPLSGVVVTATRSGGGTYTATSNAKGIYALAAIPSSSQYTIGASQTGYYFTNQIITTGHSTDFAFSSGNQWAVNFSSNDPNDPTGFLATAVSTSEIDLAWGQDVSNDNVMVAWNTSSTFGTPSGTYPVGGSIPGGGTVLYNGSATNVPHTGLTAGTTYYYKAWSVLGGPTYSTGLQTAATTPTPSTTNVISGVTVNYQGAYMVGTNSGFNGLIVTNAGVLTSSNGVIGNSVIASTNYALVTGAGSLWSNSGSLSVGSTGSFNQLTISNTGQVADSSGYIGYDSAASNNSVLITGAGSLWSNSGGVYVGYSGSSNSLTIVNSGQVVNSASNSYIGYNASADNNAVLVSGSGSVWTNSSILYVGYNGSSNRLTITNGGRVFDNSTYIGFNAGSSSNSVLVSGSGSLWNNSGSLYVSDDNNFGNNVTIANSGQVFSSGGYIGSFSSSSSNNWVLVTGPGSIWSNSGTLTVGNVGSGNGLTITNGGQVFSSGGYIGNSGSASNNWVLVTGTGSIWNSKSLYIGFNGSLNSLTLTNGGAVSATNVVIGYSNSIGNVISVSVGNLYATNAAGTGTLDVRNGALTFNSGTVVVNRLYLTNKSSSVMTFNGGMLNSGGSTVNNGSLFQVGNGISTATLNLLGGAHSFANSLFINTNAALIGTGAITGSITDAGLIAPGNSNSLGFITDTGNLTMLGNGVMTMELGGTNTWLYDQFDLTGTFTFGGTLNVLLVNSYTPQLGDQFNLFGFSSAAGSFSQINLPTLSPTLYWNTSLLYSSG